MKLNFGAVLTGEISYADLVSTIKYADLRTFTNDLFDEIESIVAGSQDTDVTFVPHDPEATEGDERGWTLAHVITHLTATLEEAMAASAMLARGVQLNERLRYETPWETIQSAQQFHARLQESRRMCNAFLEAWPDEPHLDLTATRVPRFGPMNAIGSGMLGILHGQMHINQLREILQQARAQV